MNIKRYPLEKHTDQRGLLVQNDYPELKDKFKHFLVSFSEPGIIRGNHYHKYKIEWFYVIKGTAKLVLEHIETKEQQTMTISEEKPELVEMIPNFAHAIHNIGDTELVFLGLVNEPFDPDNPDTIPYTVIE